MSQIADSIEFITRAFQRVKASYLFYSGELARRQADCVIQGKPPWRIISYRRIVNPEDLLFPIPLSSYIRPQTFKTQLRYLASNCSVLPLMELVEKVAAGEALPPNPVALTFDCGYIDCYTNAFPLLQRYGLPATIFAPTVFIGSMNMFWDEKLLASLMALKSAGMPLPRFDFFDPVVNEALDRLAPQDEITTEAAVCIIDYLPALDEIERLSVFGCIGQLLEESGGLPIERVFLNWDEVRQMAQSIIPGGVTFAPLGHSHVDFTTLTPEEIAIDLRMAFESFRQHAVEPLPVISFPQGAVDKAVTGLLGSLGLEFGVVDRPATTESSDNFKLFGRHRPFQERTYCKELFACGLWDPESLGVR